MVHLFTQLVVGAIPENGALHGRVVHLEAELQIFVNRLHPSSSIHHYHVLHSLHPQREGTVAHILLECQNVHNLLAFRILEHGLKLENPSRWQRLIDHGHSGTIRSKSEHA